MASIEVGKPIVFKHVFSPTNTSFHSDQMMPIPLHSWYYLGT